MQTTKTLRRQGSKLITTKEAEPKQSFSCSNKKQPISRI